MSDEPFIRKGELVIVDGRLICEVKADIERYTPVSIADFHWHISPPKSGKPLDIVPGFRQDADGRPDIFLNGVWLSERGSK